MWGINTYGDIMKNLLEHVMKMESADLRKEQDAIYLLEIRNLEMTRVWTNDPDHIIELENHLSYIKSRLGTDTSDDITIVYFVFNEEGTIEGYQRFDQDKGNPRIWIVSTAFKPTSQGKGFGTRSMQQGIDLLTACLETDGRPLESIHAWIHPGNMPSIKMCVRSGFMNANQAIEDKVGRSMDLYICKPQSSLMQ
jgi:L-amino acid N-acyltransferase YncA